MDIKFKGRRLDTGEYVEGFYFEGFTGIPYILTLHDHILGMTQYYEVDPATVEIVTPLYKAAPAMYEALRSIVNNMPASEIELAYEVWGTTNTRIILKVLEMGRQVLAKADGKEV